MAQMRALQLSQKIGKEVVRFSEAVTTPFFMDPLLPELELPYKSMVETSIAPLSDIVLSLSRELTSKGNPLLHLYAVGNGSLLKGIAKKCSSKFVAVGSMMAMGYVFQELAIKYLPDLILSENPIAQLVAKTIIIESYRFAVFRPASYIAYRGIDALGMKIWNCITPTLQYAENQNDQLHLIQKAGAYCIRWVRGVGVTEAILYYLRDYLRDTEFAAVATDPRLQIGLLLASDLVFELGNYFSRSLNPFANCKVEEIQDSQEDLEQVITEDHENAENQVIERPCLPRAAKIAAIMGGVCLATAVINEISILISPRDPEAENAFQQRMIGYASFAVPLGVKFLTEEVGPKIMGYCRSLFFNRSQGETAALLPELQSVTYFA